jgi:putative FmdB family regulatory protein
MPIYEFECTKCGHQFESIQKIADAPPPCEECQGETQKLMSTASLGVSAAGSSNRRVGKKAAKAASGRDPYEGTVYDTKKDTKKDTKDSKKTP